MACHRDIVAFARNDYFGSPTPSSTLDTFARYLAPCRNCSGCENTTRNFGSHISTANTTRQWNGRDPCVRYSKRNARFDDVSTLLQKRASF